MEVMDAMHPDGPVNYSKETKRGARLANKYLSNGNPDGPWTSSKPPKAPKKPKTNTIKQKPFRKIADKKTVYNTKVRSVWSPQPAAGYPTPGTPVGNTSGINKPTIKGTARIGTKYNFPATGRPVGIQSNRIGGEAGRQLFEIIADNKAWSTDVRMKIHQQNLARAAKISRGANIIGVALAAGEAIYKGTKRALGPGGREFHTGTGVPIWEDRNRSNQNTKLNY